MLGLSVRRLLVPALSLRFLLLSLLSSEVLLSEPFSLLALLFA